MTTQSEYLKALEEAPKEHPIYGYDENECRVFFDNYDKETRLALRIAHRMTQEPSEGMLLAALEVTRSQFSDPVAHFNSHFKAMAAELLKEESEG